MTLEEIKGEKDKLQNDINTMLCDFTEKHKERCDVHLWVEGGYVDTGKKDVEPIQIQAVLK